MSLQHVYMWMYTMSLTYLNMIPEIYIHIYIYIYISNTRVYIDIEDKCIISIHKNMRPNPPAHADVHLHPHLYAHV